MRALVTIFTFIVFTCSPCWAFMPAKAGGIYAPGNTRTHAKQTEDAIDEFIADYFKIKSSTLSMWWAQHKIIGANENVDDGPEKHVNKTHFDDESFDIGQERLMNLRSSMIANLRISDASSARSDLGRQLHSIQDFYSHSKWVEMGNRDMHPIIGVPGQNGWHKTLTPTCTGFCENPSNPKYVLSYECADNCKSGDSATRVGISLTC